MVKKKLNKLIIDFEKCVLEERLLQIKNQKYVNELQLVKVWTIDINPRDSAKILGLVREMALQDPISLLHIKRIQPAEKELRVVLCSYEFLEENKLIHKLTNQDFKYGNLSSRHVPLHCPGTKELAQEWSRNYWPLVWKGNPNDQILNDVKLDIAVVKEHLNNIHQRSNDSTKPGLPIVTSIVDPTTNEVLAFTGDLRHLHPLKHSVMNCIEIVSQKEQEKRDDKSYSHHYLCHGYHVYTTHEPCSMCAMALIHSRVSRLIYLQPTPSTGALKPSSGEGYTIHQHKLLNSSFEVWEWIGNEYNVPYIDNNINA